MQPGDVPVTYADTTALEEDFGLNHRQAARAKKLHSGTRNFINRGSDLLRFS